jgi:alpha-ketoglutarate-dependent taurine dioxygenase
LPSTGGDTLWASAYEAYDRLSTPYRNFLEGLTAVHSAQRFKDVAARHGRQVRSDQRGAPDNVGDELRAVHPVIRTNPVTGWKGLFVNREYDLSW